MGIILYIFILVLVLLVLRLQNRQQSMEVKSSVPVARPSWALPCLLVLLAFLPVLVFLYFDPNGNAGSLVVYFAFLALCSLYGWRLQCARKRMRNWLGAFVGGAVGANVLLATTLVWGYVKMQPFEDGGLGFFGSLTAFAPYVTILGLGVGGLVLVGGWLARQWIADLKSARLPAASGPGENNR